MCNQNSQGWFGQGASGRWEVPDFPRRVLRIRLGGNNEKGDKMKGDIPGPRIKTPKQTSLLWLETGEQVCTKDQLAEQDGTICISEQLAFLCLGASWQGSPPTALLLCVPSMSFPSHTGEW